MIPRTQSIDIRKQIGLMWVEKKNIPQVITIKRCYGYHSQSMLGLYIAVLPTFLFVCWSEIFVCGPLDTSYGVISYSQT